MSITLLVVDDKKTNRDVLKTILDDEYDILEADSGQTAMNIMSRRHADISAVFIALSMPVIDGATLLAYMQEDIHLKHLSVIITAGRGETDSKVRALQLGASAYLSGPYDPNTVKHTLRNVAYPRGPAFSDIRSDFDRLTGLYSRDAFFEKAGTMTAEKEAGYYVLSCYDIDDFKMFNDRYGDEKGDEMLKHIANVLKSSFSRMEGICGRIMGDDFAVLYPLVFMDSENLSHIAQKAATPDDSSPPLSFSIGRYIVNDLSLPVSAMYDRAALAAVTVKGRFDTNTAVFNESMRNDLLAERQIVAEMSSALAAGQFEPWFQPQYNHATGDLIGAEALVRWRHPEKGIIQPGQFIPLFENNGFVYELDKYIWEQACILIRSWIDNGMDPLPISVNISRYDVYKDDLVDTLFGFMKTFEIPVELLRLEITESAFSKNNDKVISVVKQLVELGFTVEIDDFGSGYSSLNILKDVPAQVLKLDMKFLGPTDDSKRSGNILESIVRMTKWLGMSVIAEGVETKKHADFLKSIGCFYVQGFLYAKPMPLHEYESLAAGAGKERNMNTLETIDNLDNNSFWDPGSLDTLIFNSYIGGACIYEYTEDGIELLRVNDKYIRILGSVGMELEDALKLNWTEYMDEESRLAMEKALRTASVTDLEYPVELIFSDLPGSAGKTYLRSTLRVIASAGTRRLIYCTNENITEQRIAEQKKEEAAEQLIFLESTAHELLSQPDTKTGITAILKKLLEYFDGDRAYVLEFDFDNERINNTYELCAEGIASKMEDMQNMPLDLADPEKEFLKEYGAGALIAVPLRRNGKPIGIFSIDEPRRKTDQIERISALGDYIVVLLTRRELNAEISKRSSEKLAIIDGIPGGFVQLQVKNDGAVLPLFFSEGLQKLLGMDETDLISIYRDSAMSGVHPDDLHIAEKMIASMLEHGEINNVKYRIRKGGGGYLPVMVFGKMHQSPSGEIFLNIYYTDAAEEQNREDIQTDLLDNLPCGAAMYEIDGSNMTVIHLNRHYWELVGRKPLSCDSIDVYDPVHPDDKKLIPEEIASAIRENRNVECDIRIICGNGAYRKFHVDGKLTPNKNGKYMLYASYIPII